MKNYLNILINKKVSLKKYSHIDGEVKKIFYKDENKLQYLKKYKLEKIDFENNNILNNTLNKINNYNTLIFLYKLFFSEGNTSQSLKIREFIINKMINNKIMEFDDYLFNIKSLIDNNQPDKALNSIKYIKFNFFFLPKFYLFFFYIKNLKNLLEKILFKKKKIFLNLSPVINKKNEDLFSSCLENKSIAVVGPAYTAEKKGTEIDGYDIVIRLNAFEDHDSFYKEYIGSKTNIVYFNGGEFTKYEEGKKTFFLKNKFLCARKSFSEEFKKKNIRPTRKLNFNLFGGNGFVQDILIDLLHFNPREIKVFNVNFTLNDRMYSANYTKPNQVSQKDAYFVQSKVDFYSNVNFMRLLAFNNAIKVDNDLKILLNNTNYELSKLFKKFYNIDSSKIN